jgi:hypothetical protein
MTGIRYRDDIVQPYVIPFIQAQANNVTFQQDNARPHVARVVRDIDLTKLLKNACGILFQMRINAGPISTNVTG